MNRFEDELKELEEQGLKRELRVLQRCGKKVIWKGRSYLNLSSNDYLGIANDAERQKAFLMRHAESFTLSRDGLSSSSSRLLTGHGESYYKLERQLAEWYGKESALVFNSGYHANTGILSALPDKNTAVFFDKLNHASMIDGLKLSGTPYYRYRHNDMNHLESLLKKNRGQFQNAMIVSESVFSMDGDLADLVALVELKERYDCFLMIDEAHGVGVFGDEGKGLCEECRVTDSVDLIMGTFGKALAGMGAFAATGRVVRDYLVNKARSFIFSTALPPLQIEWAAEVLKNIPAMGSQRQHLSVLGRSLRAAIVETGMETRGESQIIPVILGENKRAVQVAAALRDRGFLVFPIRPPTVPPNSARLRLSLTADMNENEIHSLTKIIRDVI